MKAALSIQSRLPWLALLLILAPCSAENGDFTYRTNVSEVRLAFFATERNRNVDLLEPSDFAIVDDEWVVHNFSSFTRLNLVNLHWVVLVDGSESVLPQYRREIASVMQLLRQSVATSDDQVSMVAFSGEHPELICSRNCRDSAAFEKLLSEGARGATPLYDALVLASELAAARPDPLVRTVFIVFSDGLDTISENSGRSALSAALASEAQIYAVDLNAQRHSPGSEVLQMLADATGGRVFAIADGALPVLAALLDDLHHGYLVSYKVPIRQEGFHPVQILPTHNRNLRFRCRRGYYYSRPPR